MFVFSCLPLISGTSISRMVFVPPFNKKLYFDIYQNCLYIILLYALPLTILVVLNWKLVAAIKHSRKRHREITELGRFSTPNGIHEPASCSPPRLSSSSSQGNNSNGENNATLVLIIIILVFIICETPELILRLITLLARHVDSIGDWFSIKLQHIFSTVTELLMVCNSSVNFFIYFIFGRRFRKFMKSTFTPRASSVTHEEIPLNVPETC